MKEGKSRQKRKGPNCNSERASRELCVLGGGGGGVEGRPRSRETISTRVGSTLALEKCIRRFQIWVLEVRGGGGPKGRGEEGQHKGCSTQSRGTQKRFQDLRLRASHVQGTLRHLRAPWGRQEGCDHPCFIGGKAMGRFGKRV